MFHKESLAQIPRFCEQRDAPIRRCRTHFCWNQVQKQQLEEVFRSKCEFHFGTHNARTNVSEANGFHHEPQPSKKNGRGIWRSIDGCCQSLSWTEDGGAKRLVG